MSGPLPFRPPQARRMDPSPRPPRAPPPLPSLPPFPPLPPASAQRAGPPPSPLWMPFFPQTLSPNPTLPLPSPPLAPPSPPWPHTPPLFYRKKEVCSHPGRVVSGCTGVRKSYDRLCPSPPPPTAPARGGGRRPRDRSCSGEGRVRRRGWGLLPKRIQWKASIGGREVLYPRGVTVTLRVGIDPADLLPLYP